MQKSSSKSNSSSSQLTLASSPDSAYQFRVFESLEQDAGRRPSTSLASRLARPDHSPFTPHPALQLGSNNSSDLMPHYKEASPLSMSQGCKDDEESLLSLMEGNEGERQGHNHASAGKTRISAEKKEQALLLEYYWSHYWHRSFA